MRILFWVELFWPHVGGIQVVANQAIPLLHQRGYEFIVVTSHAGHDLPDRMVTNGIPVYRFHFWQALQERSLHLLAQAQTGVVRLKETFKPDLIEVTFPDPTVFFHWQTTRAYHAPSLVSIRLGLPQALPGNDSLVEKTLRSAQWVTANSKAILRQARLRVPEIAGRSTLLYPGLEPPARTPDRISFDPPTLLCIGRLTPQKGFDLALSALGSLHERYPNMRLMLAGDGPARTDLELQAKKLEISSRVDFLGWVDRSRLFDLLNASTMAIVPSRWDEAFGLTALEGSFMCRPVIVTRSGGLPEIIVDGETGLVVEREDVKGLAEAIAFLIEHPELAMRMAEAGRLRANALFTLERYVNESDALYRKLIARETAAQDARHAKA